MCCLVVCRLSPEMWSQNCPHIETFDNSDLFPRIGLPIISTCLPFVALLFSSCLLDLSDVVPHLPPSCLVLVFANMVFSLSPSQFQMCFPDSLPVVFHLTPQCPVVFQM